MNRQRMWGVMLLVGVAVVVGEEEGGLTRRMLSRRLWE